jgi:hypothetical protein
MRVRKNAAKQPTRWDEDNRIPLNPAVFVVFAALAIVLAGLFLLFALVL